MYPERQIESSLNLFRLRLYVLKKIRKLFNQNTLTKKLNISKSQFVFVFILLYCFFLFKFVIPQTAFDFVLLCVSFYFFYL